MECPSCGFQNIPGLRQCARCQSLLDLGGISIEPPRAPAGALSRSVRGGRHRLLAIVRRVDALRESLRRAVPAIDGADGRAILWSLIPGMGQLRRGRFVLGGAVLAVWCLALPLAILGTGTAGGWFWLMVAMCAHAMGIAAALAPALHNSSLILRLLIGAVIIALLQLLIYTPMIGLFDPLLTLARLRDLPASPVITPGDLLVISDRWTRPDQFTRGDLVLYEIEPMSGPGWYIPAGSAVDRIIGMPGDVVRIKGGVLSVNGQPVPAELAPLGPVSDLPDMLWTAGDGEYIVVPSLLLRVYGAPQQNAVHQTLQSSAVLPEQRIQGQVLWRLQPWSRFGSVE